VVDEVALVEHLKENPMFRVGLDVYEVYETNYLPYSNFNKLPPIYI